MHRYKWVLVSTFGLLLAIVSVIGISMALRNPGVLLFRIQHGIGNRSELLVRLATSDGDAIGPMLSAFRNRKAKQEFRLQALDFLTRRAGRGTDPRIEQVFGEALKDPLPALRSRAVRNIAAYGSPTQWALIVPLVMDSNPEVKLQALAAANKMNREAWARTDSVLKERILGESLRLIRQDTKGELLMQARMMVGMWIDSTCNLARQAYQKSDIVAAESLYCKAIEMDTSSFRPRIALMRHYLRSGAKQKALDYGKKAGVLMEIPRLSSAPMIDGDPTDGVWQAALSRDEFYCTGESFPEYRWVTVRSEAKSKFLLGHFQGKLYMAVIGYEDNMDSLVFKYKTFNNNVWMDDCAEIFLDPKNAESYYYQLVVNGAGGYADLSTKPAAGWQHAGRAFRDRGYWACEVVLDGADLNNSTVASGAIWGITLYRTRTGNARDHYAQERGAPWPLASAGDPSHYPLAVFK